MFEIGIPELWKKIINKSFTSGHSWTQQLSRKHCPLSSQNGHLDCRFTFEIK